MMTTNSARVVVVTSSDDFYGADKICSQVVAAISRLDRVDVDVWVPDDTQSKDQSRLSQNRLEPSRRFVMKMPIVRRSYLTPIGVLRLSRRCASIVGELRRNEIDVIYLGTSACLLLGFLARLCGVRQIVFHMQEIWTGREGQIMALLARSATEIICISGAAADSLPLALRSRATVVANAVAGPEISPGARVLGHPKTFLIASRWNSWKGHNTLLAAWGRVGSGKRLIILGGPPEVGTQTDVKALVARLANSETVEVIGEVSNIAEHLRRVDFMVVPSDKPEPFGLVAIEAMSVGVPVIGSKGGGLAEIVDDGRTGYLFTIGDEQELAAVIEKAGNSDYTEMSRSALSDFKSRFSLENFNNEIATVFLRALEIAS